MSALLHGSARTMLAILLPRFTFAAVTWNFGWGNYRRNQRSRPAILSRVRISGRACCRSWATISRCWRRCRLTTISAASPGSSCLHLLAKPAEGADTFRRLLEKPSKDHLTIAYNFQSTGACLGRKYIFATSAQYFSGSWWITSKIGRPYSGRTGVLD